MKHLGLFIITLLPLLNSVAAADDRLGGLIKGLKRAVRGGKEIATERVRPETCTHPNVEELAGQIDWLEHHLEIYGSVIPKQPDIWGEARLTKHRQQVEAELEKELSTFGPNLQAALRRSDQSALALAIALGNSVTTPSGGGATQVVTLDPSASVATGSFKRSDALSSGGFSFSSNPSNGAVGLSLEPTIVNDQLFRYLNALNELRRTNEGDDTADSPGYSLNVVRMPISVLPGHRTRQGYGAEVSFTANPILGDDLLPNTFRAMAINDQVDQLALPVVRLLDSETQIALKRLLAYCQAERSAQPLLNALDQRIDRLAQDSAAPNCENLVRYYQYLNGRREYLRTRIIQLEACWRFPELFEEDADLITFELGQLSSIRGLPSLEFKTVVELKEVRNAFLELLNDGIAITRASVTIRQVDSTWEGTIPVNVVLVENDFCKSANNDALPYSIWIPLDPISKNFAVWPEEIVRRLGVEYHIPHSLAATPVTYATPITHQGNAPQEASLHAAIEEIAKENSSILLRLLKSEPFTQRMEKIVELDAFTIEVATKTLLQKVADAGIRLLPVDEDGMTRRLAAILKETTASTEPPPTKPGDEALRVSAQLAKVIRGFLSENGDRLLGDLSVLDLLNHAIEKGFMEVHPNDLAEALNTADLANTTQDNIDEYLQRLNLNLQVAKESPLPIAKARDWLTGKPLFDPALSTLIETSELSDTWKQLLRVDNFNSVTLRRFTDLLKQLATAERGQREGVLPQKTSTENETGLNQRMRASQVGFISQAKRSPPTPLESAHARKILASFFTEVIILAKSDKNVIYGGLYSSHADRNVGQLTANGFVFASPSRTRRSGHPLPPSMVLDVYGHATLYQIAWGISQTLQSSPANQFQNAKMLVDVRLALKDELDAAYDLLSRQEMLPIWQFGCQELASAIRLRNIPQVRNLRDSYFRALPDGVAATTTGALGWCLMVESALLNELLIDEMQSLANEKGCGCGNVEGFCFWGPTPPADSRAAFNEYVQCRWPIQVFALDPATQDQNVADRYSATRELQLAAAAAAATGTVPLNAAGQYARRLELDIETIDINRTAVGFVHGQETFGWRFYPRVQSPGVPGTLGALGQTIFGGPTRDSLIRQRKLEPGIREVTAIIVMPSFVPYVTLTSRTNWFHLVNPADKELTVKDAMRLSSAQQGVTSFLNCANDCGCYRPGDVAHLTNIAEQLSHRLPLQSSVIQVPYENTLGGFELLHSGATDLAPDLNGWYGAPGIDPLGTTTLFLVGEGFSVHETRVLAGGRSAKFRLVSREIMEVEIPPGAKTLGKGEFSDRIDVHVATPYGVSNHLLIPQVEDESKTSQPIWNPGALQLSSLVTAAGGKFTATNTGLNPGVPLGVSVPMQSLGAAADLDLSIYVQTTTGLVPLGTDTITGLRFDSGTNRYVAQPEKLSSLLVKIQSQIASLADSKFLVEGSPRANFAVRGTLKLPSGSTSPTSHAIGGVLPLDVQLSWTQE